MEIILASTNLQKIREFRELFHLLQFVDLLSLHQFNQYQLPEETGITFKENAILKATHAAKHLQKWTLADDSGLVVPALNNEPGIFSARYAGPHKSEQENREKLLNCMLHLKDEEREAYCVCAIALAGPDGYIKCVEGICEGRIAEEARGRGGFGYDSLFIKNGYEKTFAEIPSVKNRISHRARAFERLIILLESLKNQACIPAEF